MTVKKVNSKDRSMTSLVGNHVAQELDHRTKLERLAVSDNIGEKRADLESTPFPENITIESSKNEEPSSEEQRRKFIAANSGSDIPELFF